jgi:5-formyltetrahydrofolate cyclo-ligase
MPGSITKAQIRSRIWNLLTQRKVALFPGAFGRTPEFRGVRKAVSLLRKTSEWGKAQRVLVLGEPILGKVRDAVIADKKTLIVPDLTRTDGWIGELDPAGGTRAKTFFQFGRHVSPVDLIIIGAVGVDHFGSRIGKGIGEADLIYALGRERGFIGACTPVVAVVHQLQVMEERATRENTDLPVDMIVTPKEVRHVHMLGQRPEGMKDSIVTPERLEAFPGLKGIFAREGIAE